MAHLTAASDFSSARPDLLNGPGDGAPPLTMARLAKAIRTDAIDTPWRRVNLALKRLMDIVGASIALVVLAPLLIALAIAIRIESRGPVLFVQERWGKDNSIFRVLKFRTVQPKACDLTGVDQIRAGDPRVTRLGAFLRRTNIDELPQLINVIRGDMSLVGPRCHVIGMQAAGMDYEKLVPHYHLRHRMRPGMTGLAQMRGLRGPTADAAHAVERARSDLEYVVTFTILGDIAIILGTIRREFHLRGRGI